MNFENWWQDKHPEIRGTQEISERDFNLMRDAWDTATAIEREACAKEKLDFDSPKRQIETERMRAEKAWVGYWDALYDRADAEIKLEQIKKILNGEK